MIRYTIYRVVIGWDPESGAGEILTNARDNKLARVIKHGFFLLHPVGKFLCKRRVAFLIGLS